MQAQYSAHASAFGELEVIASGILGRNGDE